MQFLTLLSKAQIPGSSENVQVADHLSKRHAVASESRAIRKRSSPPPPTPKAKKPLLSKVSSETSRDTEYKSNFDHRPGETLSKPRRVPQLCATSDGQPFLRFKKPQPVVLGRMLALRQRVYLKHMDAMKAVEDVEGPSAALEDQWEKLVEEQIRAEKGVVQLETRDPSDLTTKYLWSALLGKTWHQYNLERIWEDWCAKGDAMHRLVEAERDLAARDNGLPRPQPQPQGDTGASEHSYTKRHMNVAAVPYMLPHIQAARGALTKATDPESLAKADKVDPFTSPTWHAVVRRMGETLGWYYSMTPHCVDPPPLPRKFANGGRRNTN
jgi:hypothetical protein